MSAPSSAALEEVLKRAASSDWPGIEKLGAVQGVLERNKLLIAQIQENHQLQQPDALQRNEALLRALNANIASVVQAYQEVAAHVEGGAGAGAGTGTGAGAASAYGS